MDARYVGVGVATYDSPGYTGVQLAVEQIHRIGDHLSRLGFTTAYFPSPTCAELRSGLGPALSGADVVIVYWTGHGIARSPDDLRLVTRNSGPQARMHETCQPEGLVEDALAAGATQILVLLDTCYSGAAAAPAIQEVITFSSKRSTVDGPFWVGVAASSQSYEKAVSGRFVEALLKLMHNGPAADRLRRRWSAHNDGVCGDDLLKALQAEWPNEFQRPQVVQFGSAEVPILPNPHHDPDAPDRLVEHLINSARGVGPGEDGWFFTGRRRVLGEIVDWLRIGQAGLRVVTGPAGCGKSAVVGRIATLSDRRERASLLDQAPLGADDPDPGEGSVNVVVYARGQSYDRLFAELADRLAAPDAVQTDGIVAQLAQQGRCPVIIVDALDEAQSVDLPRIVTDLLVPLTFQARVLVGTRARPLSVGGTVVDLLARSGAVLDLAAEEDTAEDIRRYVVRRLAGTGNADLEQIAAEVANRAGTPEGGFLYARIVTSRLRDGPLDTTAADWTDALDASVTSALQEVFDGLPADAKRSAGNARDLLTALAWSYGKGLPAREVWPALASALAAGGRRYDQNDIDWVLDFFGGYVVEGGEAGVAVYRLFHQQLVEHLGDDPEQGLRVDRAVAALLGRQSGAGTKPDALAPYLRLYARAHRLRGSDTWVRLARRQAVEDPVRYRRELAEALSERSRILAEDGRRDEALAAASEAAEHYRELVAADPEEYRSARALALNQLANCLAALGRHADALAVAEQATEIYRLLATADPGQYSQTLGGALINLAARAAAVGQLQLALTQATKAVTIYRTAAEQEPDKYQPWLALALNNLALRQGDLGLYAQAVESARETVALRRELAAKDPVTYKPMLASSLHTLAIRLGYLHRTGEALAVIREAVTIRRELARTNSAAYLPELALSLNNLAGRLAEANQWEDALTTAQEAAGLLGTLVEPGLDAYRADLASALTVVTNVLARLGRREEAVAPAQKAVEIFRTLAASPAQRPNLAGSLSNLAIRLIEDRRPAEALAAAAESVECYRALQLENPVYQSGLDLALAVQKAAQG